MQDSQPPAEEQQLADASQERLRLVEEAGGIAAFHLDLEARTWDWSPHAAALLGSGEIDLSQWEKAVFFDDLPKIRHAVDSAAENGRFHVEFRIRNANGGLRWIVATGRASATGDGAPMLVGAIYDVTDRKALDARLLALNETLEARVTQAREEAHTLELLNRTCVAIAAEHDLERLVQMVTDASVELTHAQFGAFFYNVLRDDGESYMLYALSGASRDDFDRYPQPRNTAVFNPTFRGEAPVRSDDILADARYGKSAPYYGMPKGH
jgi:PAS domain S-box-containing protein